MIVNDPIAAIMLGLQLLSGITQMNIFIWLISGGLIYLIRALGWFIDCKLVNFIGYVYKYFTQILNESMFNEEVLDAIVKNIYLFIGVIVVFRIMMVVIKYLINPDLVGDAKMGMQSLIQRVVIGMCGIIFIPTIFDLGFRLQAAIFEDNIIQKIIIPSDMIESVEDRIEDGGNYIGTYVLAGFVSPSSSASSKSTKDYNAAVSKGDLTSLDVNKGGFMGTVLADYEYEYFFIASTVILGYVFYQILKYTIDLAVRAFKMLIYQILAPIAMVEYMIKGSDDGVFKSWKTAVISTYCMVFVRVLALWFVVFITLLMSGKSEFAHYSEGSLLATDDNLLRCIIIIALLGFMMDLPKIIGQVFGLDLEQESSATGVLKQIGGAMKGVAMGGLAIGGATVAGAFGSLKAAGGTAMDAKVFGKGNKAQSLRDKINSNKGLQKLTGKINGSNGKMAALARSAQEHKLGEHMHATKAGIIGAAMKSNQFTGAAYSSYTGQSQEQEGIDSKAKAKEQEAQRHKEITKNQEKQMDQEAVITVTTRLADSGMDFGVAEVATRVRPTEVAACDAAIQGGIATVAAATLSATDIQADGSISASAQPAMRREVEEVVTRTYQNQGVDTTLPAVQQQITQQVDQVMGSAVGSVDASGTVSLTVDTSAISASAVGLGDQTITQVVNQVQGTKVGAETLEQTKIINEQLGTIVSNTGTTAEQVTRSVEVQEDIQYNVKAQTNIQRNQVRMVDDIRENTIPTRSDREIPRGDD